MSTWDKIAALMLEKAVSSKELAYIAGVVPSAVTKWKKGSSIRNDALNRISVYFGVSVDWLLSDSSVLTRENARTGQTAPGDAPEKARCLTRETAQPPDPCRYPEGCDLGREFGQVREELSDVRGSLATMAKQLETVTLLLGAALGKGLAQPDAADPSGHGKRKAG